MTALPDLASVVSGLATDRFVAYPTETVWGLGACADRPVAIERLMAWKGRANNAPMSVLVASIEAAKQLQCEITPAVEELMQRCWPGPLTVVVPCRQAFAPGVTRSDGALGLRCSPHPVAHALATAVADAGLGPLTSTSMNPSGEPPAADEDAARAMLRRPAEGADAPLFVFGSTAGRGGAEAGWDAGGETPSTVVDCTDGAPKILREGAIAARDVEAILLSASAESPNIPVQKRG